MNPFLSRRLLINLAVVAAAVGANAFVAYTQIRGQRDADVRTLRSTDIRQNLDAYRATLDDGLAALGRFEATGRPEPAGKRPVRARPPGPGRTGSDRPTRRANTIAMAHCYPGIPWTGALHRR